MASAVETEIRELISKWERAVRDEDAAGIRANHSEDFLMFDVPPPFLSRGLDAYMETWKIFYPSQARPITFYFDQIEVTAGEDVAFATAVGTCGYIDTVKEPNSSFGSQWGFKREKAGGSSSTNIIPSRPKADLVQWR
jgi:ketosteroid isomerase-like protein